MVAPIPSGHSAEVQLELLAGGKRFALAQFGGDVLIFPRGVVLPGTTGEVRALIDGQEQRWKVEWASSDELREVIQAQSEELA